ncbi:MAG TPA: acetolactate synthase, partial [Solirubrobacterales bacterium]|nr:acetolactate synthase [Solirubrobacterales bacterium]
MATTEESARAEGGPGQGSGAMHGGRLVAKALAARGVDKLFTLSGGHLFSIYDGCLGEGIDLVDVRHEQAAAWAAEGYAKATRRPGVAALTAGPGVTNGMSAMAGAKFNRSPLVVLGGRAPEMRWGSGSLQEIDHLPFVSPVTKSAETVKATDEIAAATARAIDIAMTQPSGPTYVDYPLDVVFMEGEGDPPGDSVQPAPAPSNTDEAATLLAQAERPVIMAGTGVYWARAEEELVQLAESLGIPVFLNGMGRGCVPADHELSFSRARGKALKEADVALVIGVPLDFRLGFGGSFGEETKLIWLDEAPNELTANRRPDIELVGGIAATLAAMAVGEGGAGARQKTEAWVSALTETEQAKRAGEVDDLNDDRAPLHPLRIYKERAEVLDRDAIVIGDGGDFVSYAGRVVETYAPGCWMDPGPYGCLGAGPGQAIGAKIAHPDRQVVCLLGDGAFGFSGLEFDTMVRHNLPVVGIVGNNGIWALEYHPMKFLYGYQVAADLQQGARYDEVVIALGG